jgi:acetyl esterase/lipase
MTFLLRQVLSLTLLASVSCGAISDVAAQTVPIGPAGEAFYTPPSPLPHAEHGTVIWTGIPTTTVALPSAARNVLVLYQSLVPTLVMQGTADVTVDPVDTDLLVRKLCKNGVEVAYRVFPGADHETVVTEGNGEAQAWVEARFAGARASSNCDALPSASVSKN